MGNSTHPLDRLPPFCRILVAYIILSELATPSFSFHDCVQSRKWAMKRRRQRQHAILHANRHLQHDKDDDDIACAGGICAGLTNGPHQGGNASYPVAWNGTAGTSLTAILTVPDLPQERDGITYYIWSDIFFGDESLGRMNQLVPQLIFGSALDASSGPPDYIPQWHTHTKTWAFGAHYFFELLNVTTMKIEGHAAYGKLYPAYPGETIRTTFEMTKQKESDQTQSTTTTTTTTTTSSPAWKLTMEVAGDPSRTSILDVKQPYMGMGAKWKEPTTSWLEPNYQNMCLNACWELYGAVDTKHLPSSGATYNLTIRQPAAAVKPYLAYDFTSWERDEGNGKCPSMDVDESHTNDTQKVNLAIHVDANR